MRTGKGGSVFLGAVTAPAISLVVPAIQRVTRTYPGIEINIEVENSNVLARELLAARHDFIISRIPDDLDPRLFTTHEIGVEKACLVVRNGHPLLEKGVASLHDLAGYDWVFQPPGTLLRRKVEDIFLAAGVPLPENVVNTSSLLLTLAVVCKTDAIAPVALDMAQFICGQTSKAGESSILPIDFRLGAAAPNIDLFDLVAQEHALGRAPVAPHSHHCPAVTGEKVPNAAAGELQGTEVFRSADQHCRRPPWNEQFAR